MNYLILNILASFSKIPDINPAYMDIAKILVGTIGWIGGLTVFMWYREKNRKTA